MKLESHACAPGIAKTIRVEIDGKEHHFGTVAAAIRAFGGSTKTGRSIVYLRRLLPKGATVYEPTR